jgi:hypothetical protein
MNVLIFQSSLTTFCFFKAPTKVSIFAMYTTFNLNYTSILYFFGSKKNNCFFRNRNQTFDSKMNKVIAIAVLLITIAFSACENFSPYSIVLDNQSDFLVTVELYTGTNNEDGSMKFEEYSVSANSKKSVKSDVQTVYVESYTPGAEVDIDINESGGRIIFTNR